MTSAPRQPRCASASATAAAIVEDLTAADLRARQGSKWNAHPADVIACTTAEIDFATCPSIVAALQDLVGGQRFGYPRRDTLGPAAEMMQAFKDHAAREYGWNVERDALTVVASTGQAIFASLRAYSRRGDAVLLQTPAFPGFFKIIEQAQRQVAAHPLVGANATLEAEGEIPSAAIWLLCQPHNPTGRVFRRDELAPLARHARARGSVVVSDEIHADLCLDGRAHQPFVDMFPELAPQTVTLHSATKVFGLSGLGGAIVHFGSDELRRRFETANPPDLLGAPSIASLVAAAAAWRDGGAWRKALVQVVQDQRDHVIARLAREAPSVRMIRSEATYFLWVDVASCALPAPPWRHFLDHARVAVSDGGPYGPQSAAFVRLVGACSRPLLDEVIDRMVGALP